MGEQGRPLAARELSQLKDNHWHAEYLHTLLRAVADADFIQTIQATAGQDSDDRLPEERVRFQLTEEGSRLQSSDSSKLRDFVRQMLNPQMEQTLSMIPNLIQNGLTNS